MKQNLRSVWKCLLLTLLVSSASFSSFSQYDESSSFFEGGLTIGPSNFLGDLGGNYGKGTTFLKDNNFSMTRFFFGGFISYHPNQWLGARLALNYGKIEGNDAVIKGKGGLEEARRIRNSNFRSSILEALLLAEVYPTVLFEYEPSEVFHKIRPYGLIGIGAFHFNPKGLDFQTGNWVPLKPLKTEGQSFTEYPDRKDYKLTQMNIPMGFGIKYYLSENTSLSLELIHRKTFTDYIDDVSTSYIDPALFYNYLPASQAALAERMANKSGSGLGNTAYEAGDKRGTPTNNDAYYSFGFKLAFKLGSDNRWRNSTGCPIRF